MARRRFSRSISRGPKNNVWSVVLLDEVVVDTGVVEADIVNAGDLQAAATGFQRFTLLRVRGWLSISKDAANLGGTSVFMIVYTTDNDAGTVSPIVAATYTDEDVLWSAGADFPAAGTANISLMAPTQIELDVKAMRKIDTSRNVRFSIIGSSAGAVTVSGVLRGLVRKGGN